MYGDRFSIEIELLTRQRAKVLDKQLKESKSKQEKMKDNKLEEVQQSPPLSRSAQCLCTRCVVVDTVEEDLGIINEKDGWIGEDEQEPCTCAQCNVEILGTIREDDGWVDEAKVGKVQ